MARTMQTKYNGGNSHNVKTSPAPGSWKNLPHHVFGDIMTMLGRESIQDLQKCRQVTQSWYRMMSQMTKYKKDTIRREAESLTAKIREEWDNHHYPHLPEIVTAASLAHHGLLGSDHWMKLMDVDLAFVPAEHLASLTACGRECVVINNVSSFAIVNILDNLKCKGLYINRQSLSSEDTRSLVRAMESGVEIVSLGFRGDVSLDITALTQYSGQGKCCRVVLCYDGTVGRYREELRSWAQMMNWRVLKHMDGYLHTHRMSL